MFKPEATLRLLKERFWGAKAMERRVIRCCADNPGCPCKDQCKAEYNAFVNATDGDKRREIYHQLRGLGAGSVEARSNLSATRVKELLRVKHGTR